MLEILMITGGVFLRLMPHLPNFAPISATGLFGGTYLKKRYAILIPLLAMIISDYLLLYVSPNEMKIDFSNLLPITALFRSDTFFVWGSFITSALIGIWLRNNKNMFNIVGASLLCSLQFFVITNFGVWVTTNMYPHSVGGLWQCYLMAIPFFQGTLLGDLFYTGIFFGGYELALRIKSSSINVNV